ncbi:MAG: hypothetical protein SH809_03425, partial [Rhodothermales bacterium]|nr:hypothetical protein [Rhodothermales bacterium]
QRLLLAADPALDDLDGHFVALRWDASEPAGAISAFTDALGLRTLYRAAVGSTLYLATRLDTMAALTDRRALDDAAFGAHWLLVNQLSQHALLAGVERLGAGGTLRWKAGALSVTDRPWSPPDSPPDPTAFEKRLTALVLPEDPPGRTLSLGLSGGLDSRLLLALRTRRRPVHVHTFGDADHRDAAMARRLAGALSTPIDVIAPPFPDPDTCTRLLRDHMASTHAVSPASSVLGLQSFGILHDRGRWMIDGGFGEVARQQYLNRLRLRGRDAVSRRDPDRIAPFLRLHRVDVFSEELRVRLRAGVRREIDAATQALPPALCIDDAIDLLAIRARLPNFFGYEQNRLDGHILNYMPFAQPSLLRALFATPIERRRHGRLFRELIRTHQPVLAQFPLIKGAHSYPFALPPLPAYLWTEMGRWLRPETSASIRTRVLRHLETVIRERVRTQEVREDGRYDYSALLELIDGYYEGRHARAAELDWWLALDAWWQSLRAG